jgi:diguanylate cyclase (GGDEF)-like protein
MKTDLNSRSNQPEFVPLANCNPAGEDARLEALNRYEVLDTNPEESFDKITQLVKTFLDMPMAMVSLIDRDRQWFKSRQGVTKIETPRSISFCTHTIQNSQPLIVNDALADPRFSNSPLVVGEPHVRFYAGVPLRSRDGYNVGALCAMDTKVRELSSDHLLVLEKLAALVVDALELKARAFTDSLTGVMTRRAFDEQAVREMARAKRYNESLSCALIDIDHFKSINDAYGHGIGDLTLKRIAATCASEIRTCDYIGRIGGEEFALLLPETVLATAIDVAERLRRTVEATAIEVSGGTIRVTVSIGVAASDRQDDTKALIKRTDMALYDAKKYGRNRVSCCQSETADLSRSGRDFRAA